MIRDEVRRMVEQAFPAVADDPEGEEAEFRAMIIETLEAGQSLVRLVERLGCGPAEMVALKRIEASHRATSSP
jgi:hypothetical protein